jgi:hypothetical protein
MIGKGPAFWNEKAGPLFAQQGAKGEGWKSNRD